MIELTMNAALAREVRGDARLGRARGGRRRRRLGDAPLTAAALAGLALADSMIGAAERAEADRAEAAVAGRLPVGRRARPPPRGRGTARRASSSISTGTPRATRTPTARWPWRARPARASTCSSWSRPSAALWRQRGKLAEAGELLDGGIEAARVLGNTHALVWSLSSRSAAALRMRRRGARARDRAGERRPQPGRRRELPLGRGSRGPRRRAARDGRAGTCGRAAPRRPSGGEELVLIAGSPRARYLEVLDARLARARSPCRGANVPPTPREAWASAVQLPMAVAWADRAAAAVDLYAGEAAASSRASARVGGRRGRGRERRSRQRSRACSRAAPSPRPASVSVPPPSCSVPPATSRRRGALRYRDEAERELRKLGASHPPAHAAGQARRDGARVADRARAPGGTARRRPQDESGDRRASCSSARRRSRRTCATSSARSTSRRASSSPAPSSGRIARLGHRNSSGRAAPASRLEHGSSRPSASSPGGHRAAEAPRREERVPDIGVSALPS